MNISDITVFLFCSALAGVVGTAGMSGVMHLITRLDLANANMEVAIGSILTKSRVNAIKVGLVMHFVAGMFFAVLYNTLFVLLSVHGVLHSTGLGAIAGFVHGFAMSFILVIAVAEHHPLPEFREAGFGVAVAHVAGHVVYGALVGLVLGIAGAMRGI